ncbi:MAG: hypothetical protein CVV23_00050 [Ignavibacteriae bacterium HGW-Ignavibacteriae-2]|nr:MAG: hypothetical protein CVV23_00050 [Ignavibacteriae bacterium HGW-Ignavibacteriae-2]
MKNINFKKIIYFFLFVSLIVFLVFNNSGVLKYLKLREEIKEINIQINNTETEIEQFNAEIDSVKTSLYKIEKIARVKYHMIGTKEQALKVEKKE